MVKKGEVSSTRQCWTSAEVSSSCHCSVNILSSPFVIFSNVNDVSLFSLLPFNRTRRPVARRTSPRLNPLARRKLARRKLARRVANKYKSRYSESDDICNGIVMYLFLWSTFVEAIFGGGGNDDDDGIEKVDVLCVMFQIIMNNCWLSLLFVWNQKEKLLWSWIWEWRCVSRKFYIRFLE